MPTPPLPDQPGAYLLVDDAWILDSRTEPPAPIASLTHGPDETPAADGGPGGDLRNERSADGD